MTVPANFSYRTFLVPGLDPGWLAGSSSARLASSEAAGAFRACGDFGVSGDFGDFGDFGAAGAFRAAGDFGTSGTFRASVDGDSGDRDSGGSTKVLERPREKMKKPPMYKVLLHNDDYTTMEFVVYVLRAVFFKPPAEADQIMMNVHRQGVGIAGIYPFEVAEAKVEKVTRLARARQFPLRLTLEPE
jgi:ATP-dependent Clp protease adaptor protein ClpS